jgi:hypothetical protein
MALWQLAACGCWARAAMAAWKQPFPGSWGCLCCISSEGLELPRNKDGERQEPILGQRGLKGTPIWKAGGSHHHCSYVMVKGPSRNLVSEPRDTVLVWASCTSPLKCEWCNFLGWAYGLLPSRSSQRRSPWRSQVCLKIACEFCMLDLHKMGKQMDFWVRWIT